MQAPNYPYPDQISIVDHLGMFLAQWIFFLGMILAQWKFFLGVFLLRWQLEVLLRDVLLAVEVPLRDPLRSPILISYPARLGRSAPHAT